MKVINKANCLLHAVETPLSLLRLSYFMSDWIASSFETGTL